MPRGVTLNNLITQLRYAIHESGDSAQGQNMREMHRALLQRKQRALYIEYAWPFLKTHANIDLEAGQRYYDFPSDIALESVSDVTLMWGASEIPLDRGIGQEQYAQYDSDGVAWAGTFT